MPIVEVPGMGPVEFPDGMSNADMEKAIAKTMAHKQGQMALEGTNAGQRFLIGTGKALTDLWQGAQQLVGKTSEADVAAKRNADAAIMDTTAGKVGNFAGTAAATVPAMFVPGANTYAGAGLLGAGMGLLTPTVEGESKVTNAAVGAGAGVIGQGIGNAIGRAIRPVRSELSPEAARLAQEAAARNIPLTAGQATGSRPLQITESVMENLPFTSGPQLAQRQAQREAFNRAVGATFGAPENAITPEVAGAARNRIGQTFTDLSARNAANVDNAVLGRISGVIDEANRYNTPDVARVIGNYADDIMSRIDANGEIPGQAYRALDSQMGRTMRGSSNGDLRNYVGQLRDVMREAMDGSISAADQEAWRQARREYANLMTVAPLAAKSETGDVSARTLLSAANQSNRNARFGGESELAELGRIGRAFVADQIPNSGTAQRQFVQSLITGGGGAGVGAIGAAATGNNPMEGAAMGLGVGAAGLLTPRLIQAAMNSPAGQAYLTRGLLELTPAELAAINAIGRGGAVGLLGNAAQ
jgi:hypothetical protein